jgi:homogentisate phytyltransferase/homogentisate geranylgeranyltransferase
MIREMNKLSAFVRFTRPHTFIATTLQVTGLFLIAGGAQPGIVNSWFVWLLALVSSLAINLYIVGLNQLTDVGIDLINKPYLPLASGEFSLRLGRWIVGLSGLLAIGLAALQSSYMFVTIGLALLVGTLYSLPPWRLKSRPVWAALCVAFVRGFVVNVGLYLHFHQIFQPASPIPWLLVGGLATFFFGFGLVIAIYKDIPDLAGDRQFGIRTFSISLGPVRVFNSGRWLLTAFFLVPISAALLQLPQLGAAVYLLAQIGLIALFWFLSWDVDPAEPAAITRFYMFLWALFYAQYILLSIQVVVGSATSLA